MPFKFLYFTVLCLAVPLLAYTQPTEKQNPCKDSLLLKLKKIPQVSLNMAERKYLEQKEKECAEFAKSQTLQKDTAVHRHLNQMRRRQEKLRLKDRSEAA